MQPRLLCVMVLVACGPDPFIDPQTPIGVGLTATLGVSLEHCSTALVNDSCYDEALPIARARATSEIASIVDIDDYAVHLRGNRAGTATGVIDTETDGSVGFAIEIVPLVEHALEIIGLERGLLEQTPALMLDARFVFRQVNRYEAPSPGGGQVWTYDARGFSEVTLDPHTTAATLDAHEPWIWYVSTGARTGHVTLATALGFQQPYKIVGPDELATFGFYHLPYNQPPEPVTAIPLRIGDPEADIGRPVAIIPTTRGGQPVAGCAADPALRPIIEGTSPNVVARIYDPPGMFCGFELFHTAAGPGFVTVAWGSARATLAVTDPDGP